jgi:hypothetical protein
MSTTKELRNRPQKNIKMDRGSVQHLFRRKIFTSYTERLPKYYSYAESNKFRALQVSTNVGSGILMTNLRDNSAT